MERERLQMVLESLAEEGGERERDLHSAPLNLDFHAQTVHVRLVVPNDP